VLGHLKVAATGLSGSILIIGASQVVTLRGGPRRGKSLSKIGLVKNGAVLVRDGKIVAAGVRAEVERRTEAKAAEKIGCGRARGFAGICGFAHTPDSCREPGGRV